MLCLKEREFLEGMLPIIEELAGQWFPPGKKIEHNGEMVNVGCGYCDMECGGTERHDSYCILQLAKNTKEALQEIENSHEWDLDWKKRPRPAEGIEDMKDYWRVRKVFELFLANNIRDFIPFDHHDPVYKNVCCTCIMFNWDGNKDWKRHHPNCPTNRIAKVLGKLFAPVLEPVTEDIRDFQN